MNKETKISKENRELEEEVKFWKIACLIVIVVLAVLGGLYTGGVI